MAGTYFPQDNHIQRNTKAGYSSLKKVLSPFDKLKRRIDREFTRKKLIGDIAIDDSEFELLVRYIRNVFRLMKLSSTSIKNDKVFCTALVHIGIRYYDGNYWKHVENLLMQKFNANHQAWFGDLCIRTLKANGKYVLSDSDRVSTILMHGFVANNYAGNLFNFLFAFYRIDLERDITRLNSNTMKSLLETMERKDNTGRTYQLVRQTSDAICANRRGSNVRIRRLLRLIDSSFWGNDLYRNSQNRLTVMFYHWRDNSQEFNKELIESRGSIGKPGKKAFLSPYIKCNFENFSFKLILPPQIINFSDKQDIWWDVALPDRSLRANCVVYEAVSGNKTEEVEINLHDGELFSEMKITLMSGKKKIRTPFKLKEESIRFFHKEYGYLVPAGSIGKGEIYSFSPLSFIPKSDALVEINRIRDHNFSYFDFQIGDIVRLPDGKPISVGKRPEEGLLERGLVEGAFAMSETGNVPVYSAPPSVLVKMLPNRTNGTAIIINGVTNRLFDAETISDIELGDRSGEKGYLFSLKDYGCLVNGIYDVYIDVPNDRTNRHWKFALINGLNFEFEDSPYIFAPKGTIRFDTALKVKSEDAFLENDKEKNTFNFLIDAEHDTLHFSVDNLRLMIDVPMFAYKFDDGPWETQHPSDIWYTDFPKKIYIRYLAEKLKLIVDEKNNEEEARREITYEKLKSGLFECDVTWLRSWFSRNEAKKKVYVELSGSKQHFVDVVTKSIIVSSIIKGDFKKGTLIGSFDIIGKSNYFADISYNGSILANKIPIINGQLEFPADLLSGKYEVAVFEEELDNGGFNTTYYYPLQTFIRDLINPADLRGKNIRIRYIKNGIDSIFKIPLRHSYKVVNLRRHDKQDRHNYIGDLIDDTLKKVLLKVNVYIPDLNQLQYSSITFFDEYGDLVELLYDHKTGEIVSEEQNGLRPSEKYRRYECLFSDEYFFGFDFV